MSANNVDSQVLEQSKELATIWIAAYLEEINRIEHFFLQKQNDLINQFILLQDKFRIKAELYENEKQEKKAKKERKEKQALEQPEDKKQQLQEILNYGQSRLSERLTPNRAKDINFSNSNYSKRTELVVEGEAEQAAAVGLYQSQTMIFDKTNLDASFSTPTQQRSVLLQTNLNRSTVASNIGGNLIPEKKKFTNR